MIEHEILFLGLLMERPKHGYDIKRQVEDELVPFIGLEIKSIYYPLKKMEESGLIKKEIGREGNWPEKVIYSITPKGKKKFEQLIAKSFLSVERPYFQMNLSLYFLQYVDKTVAKRRLQGRLVLLKKIRKHLADSREKLTSNTQYLLCIIQHDLDLCDAEIQSITRLISTI
jgi:DNA-binding PadR family transcriptional regulator